MQRLSLRLTRWWRIFACWSTSTPWYFTDPHIEELKEKRYTIPRVWVTTSHTACGTVQTTFRVKASSIQCFNLCEFNPPGVIRQGDGRGPSAGGYLAWTPRFWSIFILMVYKSEIYYPKVGGWRTIRKLLLSRAHLPHCFWIVGRL